MSRSTVAERIAKQLDMHDAGEQVKNTIRALGVQHGLAVEAAVNDYMQEDDVVKYLREMPTLVRGVVMASDLSTEELEKMADTLDTPDSKKYTAVLTDVAKAQQRRLRELAKSLQTLMCLQFSRRFADIVLIVLHQARPELSIAEVRALAKTTLTNIMEKQPELLTTA